MVAARRGEASEPGRPDTVHLFGGAASRVAPILDRMGARRLFLVLDEQAYERSGADRALAGALAGRDCATFTGFEPNPKLQDVERGVALFRGFDPEAILAVGGGTAIDLAKMIGTCGAQTGAARDLVTGASPLRTDGPPLIAVPTTAGTGSEATHFAVAYVDGVKHSMAHAHLRPDHAIVDAVLTHAMPPGLTAATGLDALSQGLESLWAVGATEESLPCAVRAVALTHEHLATAVLNPTPAARSAMAEAAFRSGQAIDVSKTTAPHAVSYAISTEFGVPHGVAVALTLGAFLRFNAEIGAQDCADPRGPEDVRARIATGCRLLGAASPREAEVWLATLLVRLGCPSRLRDVGITDSDLVGLAAAVNVERLSNNPRRIDQPGLTALLASVL